MKKKLLMFALAVIGISMLLVPYAVAEEVTEVTEVTEATTAVTAETTIWADISDAVWAHKDTIGVIALAVAGVLKSGLIRKSTKAHEGGVESKLKTYGNAMYSVSQQASETLTKIDEIVKGSIDQVSRIAQKIEKQAEYNSDLLQENIDLKNQVINIQTNAELRDAVLTSVLTDLAKIQQSAFNSTNIPQSIKDTLAVRFDNIEAEIKKL